MLKRIPDSFTCDTCKKAFPNKYNLTRHKTATRSCKRGYSCIRCTRAFKHKCMLLRHLNSKKKCEKNRDSLNIQRTIKLEIKKIKMATKLEEAKQKTLKLELQVTKKKKALIKNINKDTVERSAISLMCCTEVFDVGFVRDLFIPIAELKSLISEETVFKSFERILKNILNNPKRPEYQCIKKLGHADVYKVFYKDKGWSTEDYSPNVKGGMLNIVDDTLRSINRKHLSKNKRKIFDTIYKGVIHETEITAPIIKKSMDNILKK